MKLSTDHTLVTKYICGDERAFAEIIARYHHSLWWTARRHVSTDYDAQDILQDAYFNAALNMHHYRAEASLKTWLRRLVLNASHDHRRRRYRTEETAIFDDQDVTIPHQTYDPISALDLTLTMATILSCLNEHQRQALIFVDLLGHTIHTAAKEMEVSAGTIKSRRSRAQRIIRTRHPELVGM